MVEEMPVQISRIDRPAVLHLKAWLQDHERAGEAMTLAGALLPSKVGATTALPLRVLCTGPAEWLILSQDADCSRLLEAMGTEHTSRGLAAVDLTGGLEGLSLHGNGSRELLGTGCGLDMHAREFPAGRCARTRFAQVPMILVCLDESPRYELFTPRSCFQYLQSWLVGATAGYRGTPHE